MQSFLLSCTSLDPVFMDPGFLGLCGPHPGGPTELACFTQICRCWHGAEPESKPVPRLALGIQRPLVQSSEITSHTVLCEAPPPAPLQFSPFLLHFTEGWFHRLLAISA